MKKTVTVIITAMIAFCSVTTVFAAGEAVAAGADIPLWSEAETPDAAFYQKTEASSAAAIVNTDSFVDRAADETNFDVPCKAALLMDETTGQVLYAKNASGQLPIASITKIMTMLLVFEALDSGKIKLQDTVPVTEHAFSMGGSQILLEPGEVFTVDELLRAVAVSSANDAAVALAEFMGGSESVFCDMMNTRAKELGMEVESLRAIVKNMETFKLIQTVIADDADGEFELIIINPNPAAKPFILFAMEIAEKETKFISRYSDMRKPVLK